MNKNKQKDRKTSTNQKANQWKKVVLQLMTKNNMKRKQGS